MTGLRSTTVTRPDLTDACRGNASVNRAAFQLGVFRNKAQRADLALGTNIDTNLDHAAQSDGYVAAESQGSRFNDASLDGMARKVHVSTDHDIIAKFEKVVVAQRKAGSGLV